MQTYTGKYRGVVLDNHDPMTLGRLRVQVPAVLKDMSVWAMPCVPFAGPNAGLHTLPEPGTGVWVEFEAGDPAMPIWSGFFWQPEQLPKDETGSSATPPCKILRTESGLLISLDDERQALVLGGLGGESAIRIEVHPERITIRGAGRLVIESPHIELTDSAAHPVVLGDHLLQYLNQLVAAFNSHLHPGQLAGGLTPVTPAPPIPVAPPPTPSILSTRVTTE